MSSFLFMGVAGNYDCNRSQLKQDENWIGEEIRSIHFLKHQPHPDSVSDTYKCISLINTFFPNLKKGFFKLLNFRPSPQIFGAIWMHLHEKRCQWRWTQIGSIMQSLNLLNPTLGCWIIQTSANRLHSTRQAPVLSIEKIPTKYVLSLFRQTTKEVFWARHQI